MPRSTTGGERYSPSGGRRDEWPVFFSAGKNKHGRRLLSACNQKRGRFFFGDDENRSAPSAPVGKRRVRGPFFFAVRKGESILHLRKGSISPLCGDRPK